MQWGSKSESSFGLKESILWGNGLNQLDSNRLWLLILGGRELLCQSKEERRSFIQKEASWMGGGMSAGSWRMRAEEGEWRGGLEGEPGKQAPPPLHRPDCLPKVCPAGFN